MVNNFHFATWAHRVTNFGGSPQEVDTHVNRLADAGFDLIIPCVKNPPGYADFHTDVAQVNPDYPDWDPLRVLTESADRRGMKVHAWFCVFRDAALIKKRPNLAAVHETGDMGWACACHPDVQAYELALYRNVAENYPLHGLHLDYIRTGGACRCSACKAQMAAGGIDIGNIERKDPALAAWTDWRCDRVTAFVEQMRALTREKGIELSAAVFGDLPACRNANSQDWGLWAEKDLVDLMLPMNYDNSTRNMRLRTRAHVALVDNHCPVWEGLGKSSSMSQLTTEVMMDQIRTAKSEGASGAVLFSYPALSDEDLEAIQSL